MEVCCGGRAQEGFPFSPSSHFRFLLFLCLLCLSWLDEFLRSLTRSFVIIMIFWLGINGWANICSDHKSWSSWRLKNEQLLAQNIKGRFRCRNFLDKNGSFDSYLNFFQKALFCRLPSYAPGFTGFRTFLVFAVQPFLPKNNIWRILLYSLNIIQGIWCTWCVYLITLNKVL